MLLSIARTGGRVYLKCPARTPSYLVVEDGRHDRELFLHCCASRCWFKLLWCYPFHGWVGGWDFARDTSFYEYQHVCIISFAFSDKVQGALSVRNEKADTIR